MKKLIRITLIILILGMILAGVFLWIGRKTIHSADFTSSRIRTELGKKDNNFVDILVLGDSESYTSVSPMQLWQEQGMTAYVCGEPGQKIYETYNMLKTAFQVQSPKIVLMETNLMFRNPGPVADIQNVSEESSKQGLSGISFHNFWRNIFSGKKPGEEAYKGFVLRGGVTPFDSGDYMKETKEVQKIPEGVRIYMKEIQRMCREKNATLVLMSAPSPKNYNFKKHNAVAQYAEDNGLTYFDLNLHAQELGMDWKTDSYDKGDHLNLNGARKVTTWVGKYLKENYELTDHRGDQNFKSWDNEIEKYESSVRKLAL